MLVAVLHFIKDEEDPAGIVAQLRDALPDGSYLVLSHTTADFHGGNFAEIDKIYTKATATLNSRPHAEILSFFEGFDLLDPGLVQVPLWRPDGPPPPPEELRRVGFYGAVATRR
jgi:hypothetical protein